MTAYLEGVSAQISPRADISRQTLPLYTTPLYITPLPTPLNRMTDRCKNITFPILRMRSVIINIDHMAVLGQLPTPDMVQKLQNLFPAKSIFQQRVLDTVKKSLVLFLSVAYHSSSGKGAIRLIGDTCINSVVFPPSPSRLGSANDVSD